MRVFLTIFIYLMASTALLARPFCVSHRALGFGELENSMAAFVAAGEAGVAAIEFDLLHTKDNKTIVYHDKKLKRMTKGANCPSGSAISKLNFEQIDKNCRLVNGEKIPTFSETLETLSKFKAILFVELKDSISEADFSDIKKYYSDRPSKLVIISFKAEALDTVLKKRETDDFFKQIKTLLLKKRGNSANIERFDGLNTKYIKTSKVDEFKRQGKLIGVYTKNSGRKIRKYLKKGSDFITTDEPMKCEKIIEEIQSRK